MIINCWLQLRIIIHNFKATKKHTKKKSEFEDDEVNKIIKNLLARGTATLQNLEAWIKLFNYSIEKNEDRWINLLTNSLKEWWNSDNFGEKFTEKCYHRKVMWFLHPSRYNKIEKDFRKVFKELVELKADYFYFDDKCWDDDDSLLMNGNGCCH
ncbi:hypothetical protein RFI_39237 [Reticulomyxa filosa]|uniref:Uncharacterized protein n=1 Tax=Reticulomyxa filosa TaxID=46433 RepID=X6LAW2_RETFI|nr:hypothetical protein RFI_39237 [Reticulomyxa filosa]|eukprot:ETN98271.1 hypothetical protein RFI_39237 [Reticulomyxa filosa]